MKKKWEKQWDKMIPDDAIINGVNAVAVDFAKEFGEHLAANGKHQEKRYNPKKKSDEYLDVNEYPLTTSQLRRFFGEIKRQQMTGFVESSFVLLKPKLAYAVGRAKQNSGNNKYYKIEDFYNVLSNAIDLVVDNTTKNKEQAFRNFIAMLEAIVAYHKAAVKE